jgi:multidrug resistance efflux pump
MAQKALKGVDLAETANDQIKEAELLTVLKREMVKEARRGLTAAEDELKYSVIRAPFPGVVVKRYRHLGDFASAGSPVLSMYNPDLLYVTANLEETRLPGVATGNPVSIQTHVVVGESAATAILDVARSRSIDLIAIATHGRGGLKRLLLGSVTDKIVRGTSTPVLIYRPTPSQ